MISTWKIVNIGNSGLFIADGNYSAKYPSSKEFVSTGIPFIRANNFKNKTIVDNDLYFISPSKHAEITKGHLKSNDVLITTRGNIGELAIVPERHENSNINAQIVLLRCNNDWYPLFLLFVLSSSMVREQLAKLTTGTALKQLPVKNLKKLQIPLPPLEQQIKIASILDAADTYRQKTKALIAKYDELTQSLFLNMFGDPVKNEKGWELKQLHSLVSKLGDGIHGTPVYSEEGEYYFINGNNLQQGKVVIDANTKRVSETEYLKHKKVLGNTTVLVSINGSIGKVAFYNNEPIILGKSACYFNLIEGSINKTYLYHIIDSPFFLKYASSEATGSTIKNVSLKSMRNFPIPIPSITIQNQFAERVQAIEVQKVQAQASLEKAEELFNSLLQKAFKGEPV
jgi:type I restriction enzyme S subunit